MSEGQPHTKSLTPSHQKILLRLKSNSYHKMRRPMCASIDNMTYRPHLRGFFLALTNQFSIHSIVGAIRALRR